MYRHIGNYSTRHRRENLTANKNRHFTFLRASFPFLPIQFPLRSTSSRLCDACTSGARADAPASVKQFPLKINRDRGTIATLVLRSSSALVLRSPSPVGNKLAPLSSTIGFWVTLENVTPSSSRSPCLSGTPAFILQGDDGTGPDPPVSVPMQGGGLLVFAVFGWWKEHLRKSICTTCCEKKRNKRTVSP